MANESTKVTVEVMKFLDQYWDKKSSITVRAGSVERNISSDGVEQGTMGCGEPNSILVKES